MNQLRPDSSGETCAKAHGSPGASGGGEGVQGADGEGLLERLVVEGFWLGLLLVSCGDCWFPIGYCRSLVGCFVLVSAWFLLVVLRWAIS